MYLSCSAVFLLHISSNIFELLFELFSQCFGLHKFELIDTLFHHTSRSFWYESTAVGTIEEKDEFRVFDTFQNFLNKKGNDKILGYH